CDTQVQIHVESVVMRDEWARDRPTWNGLHHRRLDFEKIERIEKIAPVLDDPRSRQEHTAALWVDYQIYVALPIARLLIDQPVPLVGQGTQRLGQQSQGFHSDGQLASLRLEEHALCAEDIANVPVLELFVDLPERLGLQEELYLTAAVHELGEAGLAHDPFHHHPPAHLDADRVLVKPLGVAIAVGGQELVCKRIAPKIVRIRLTRRTKPSQLSAALGDELVLVDWVVVVAHVSSIADVTAPASGSLPRTSPSRRRAPPSCCRPPHSCANP